MSKIDYVQLETVEQTLKLYFDDKEKIALVLKSLQMSTTTVDAAAETPTTEEVEAAVEGDKEGTPKVKKQYVIVVSDPDKLITKDLTGWVVQIPEDEDVSEVNENLKKAAYNFNASKKGNKYPVSSIGSAINSVPGKFFKPYGISLKTKEPVYVVRTDNKLPRN